MFNHFFGLVQCVCQHETPLTSRNYLQVSPGVECSFSQDVVAINTAEKQCCQLGELGKRAVVTPDVDFLLNNLM